MLVPIEDLTAIGVVKDVRDYLLSPNAFTDARNFRAIDGGLARMGGSKAVLDPPSVAPYWALHVTNEAKASHWIYAGLEKVYTYTSGAHFDITRVSGDYNANADDLWNGGAFNGLAVLNNGVDVPQVWGPIDSGTPLIDLPNWPAGQSCKILRPFKNYLFALDLTISGDRFPHRLKISHPADPGTVPVTWDETDPSKDVVSRDIGDDDSDGLAEAVPLGGIMVLYKQRTTHYAQYIGGTQKWKTDLLFKESGILGDNCAVAFDQGRRHFVLTGDDIIVHDGQTRTSILEKKDKRWLQANVDPVTYLHSFCVPYTEKGECWACVPLSGSTWPNLAVVWNSVDNSVMFRELDQASFIAPGTIPQETSDPWDSDSATWDSDLTTWDTLAHQAFLRRLLQTKPTATKLLHLEATEQFDGVDFTAYVERTGLDLIGMSDSGQVLHDREARRIIRGVWLEASGAPISVQIGTQGVLESAVTWSPAATFTPGVDKKVDFALETGLFGIRLSVPAGAASIQGLYIDIEPTGQF